MAIILDNSNLNESYAGVTTPLTFSFAQRIYARVYRQFCQMLGVSKKVIRENDEFFESMLASVGGKMYYNLSSWHHMIGLLPAYRMNGPFLEEMMGIEAKNKGKIAVPYYTKVIATVETFTIIIRMISIFLTMPRWQSHFNSRFEKEYSRLQQLLKQDLSVEKMIQYYLEAENVLTNDFRIPIVNDFAVMISTGLLKKIYTAKGVDPNQISFQAHAGVKSSEPGKFIEQLVELIQGNEKYRELFSEKHSPDEMLRLLESYPDLKQEIEFYKQEYGYRIPGELKLESLSFMNDSKLLLSFLQHQILRKKVKTDATAEVATSALTLPFHQRWIKSWAESSITRREQTRFQRTLIFGLARDTFLKIGEKFFKKMLISSPRDIFYLTVEEVVGFEHGDSAKTFKKKVQFRQAEEKYFESLDIPSHLVLKSYPVSDLKKYEDKKSTVRSVVVKGQVASNAGLESISGEALVLEKFDPTANFHDKILITHHTDPGWTIIFPFLKGIVVERGGLLSHAAIVAREFHIPCIINAKEVMRQVSSGDAVMLNLKTGEVTWKK